MKKLNYFLMSLIIFLSMIFYSCHTETPVNVDHESPEIQRIVIYTSANSDTLYKAIADSVGILKDTTFVNFEQTLESIDGDINIELSVVDNGNLYNADLIAKDAIKDSLVQLGSKRFNSDGNLTFIINASNFPAIQDSSLQQFYLYFLISDDTDNIATSSELGFKVEKTFVQEILFNELGLLRETRETVANRDFRDKIGELAFIQFMANG